MNKGFCKVCCAWIKPRLNKIPPRSTPSYVQSLVRSLGKNKRQAISNRLRATSMLIGRMNRVSFRVALERKTRKRILKVNQGVKFFTPWKRQFFAGVTDNKMTIFFL